MRPVVEIGFGNSISTVDGIAGAGAFPQKTDECLHQLATLYPQYFQVVVLADAKINTGQGSQGQVDRGAVEAATPPRPSPPTS